jgi:regulator of sigma E protease
VYGLSIIITVIILGLLIVSHELGHFLAAKAVGIKVHEFAIGMGPKIFVHKGKETLFTLRILPIGGYNRMAGMEPDDEDHPRGFNKKSVGKRSFVIFAGSFMNFVLALLIFIIVFTGLGIPTNQNIIGGLVPGGAAQLAGLREGDQIVAINNEKTETWNDLTTIIHNSPGKELEFKIKRNGELLTVRVTPVLDPEYKVGLVGIERMWAKQGLLESIVLGIQQAVELGYLLVVSLVQMIIGRIPAEVAGPVGMVQMIGEAAEYGMASILNFAAILSLNLGLINLFPVPALDGSRLIFLGLEWLRGKPIQREKENFIHFVGFFLLIGLMVLITYQDILRLFSH